MSGVWSPARPKKQFCDAGRTIAIAARNCLADHEGGQVGDGLRSVEAGRSSESGDRAGR